MPQKIFPFEDKLKQRVGATLEAAGFVASKVTIEREKICLIYQSKTNPQNKIWFYAMPVSHNLTAQRSEFNWLLIQVVSAYDQFSVFPIAPQDVPQDAFAGAYSRVGWIYNDEAGLDRSLDDIGELVEQNFRHWFEPRIIVKQLFEIDGERFSDLEGFYAEISKIVGDGWGKNLDAFADILLGAMGTPFDDPFILIWKNSALSRERLGYEATQKWFENLFQHYSKGLSLEEFTNYMRSFNRSNKLKRFFDPHTVAEVDIERALQDYRAFEQQIELARRHEGETIFDWIMACFRDVPEIEVRLE